MPTHWSPEQATAVFEFVDALRDEIWGLYGFQIQRVLRNDRVTTPPILGSTNTEESINPL